MRMRAKIARKMSFDPYETTYGSGLRSNLIGTMNVQWDATEVDLSGSDLDNVSSETFLGSSTHPDTIRFRTIHIQSRLNPLPIASTLAQCVARYVAQITSVRII